MVSIADLLYLCSSDLKVLNIDDIMRLYGPHFHANNWETYALYIQLRGDKIDSKGAQNCYGMEQEEKEFYLNIIKDLKKRESKKIKLTLDRLNEHDNNNRLTPD